MILLNKIAEKLKSVNLTINLEKWHFCRSSLEYLGFVIDRIGLRTNPKKIEAMTNYTKPRTVTEMRRFLGMASWYRRFVRHFAEITAPLYDLTKRLDKNHRLMWTEKADEAFNQLKSILVTSPVLTPPDFSEKF